MQISNNQKRRWSITLSDNGSKPFILQSSNTNQIHILTLYTGKKAIYNQDGTVDEGQSLEQLEPDIQKGISDAKRIAGAIRNIEILHGIDAEHEEYEGDIHRKTEETFTSLVDDMHYHFQSKHISSLLQVAHAFDKSDIIKNRYNALRRSLTTDNKKDEESPIPRRKTY